MGVQTPSRHSCVYASTHVKQILLQNWQPYFRDSVQSMPLESPFSPLERNLRALVRVQGGVWAQSWS